ncbi:hypothetical protein AQUCO_00700168v1 [Aquilegia coerulea]|uniref:Uncharacterized protein n=1 Tax=Aquilegia coerulea TaxID=218851 RepID=A0A2G5EIS3_AQUCA|nr:hypothetical protein AQUCO_00700168v1 [Aquilegia coerulea]
MFYKRKCSLCFAKPRGLTSVSYELLFGCFKHCGTSYFSNISLVSNNPTSPDPKFIPNKSSHIFWVQGSFQSILFIVCYDL